MNKTTQDDDILAGIIIGGLFGGLVGASLALPKLSEQDELQQYRVAQQQLLIRKQRIGNLSILYKLRQRPALFNLFVESFNMFIYGFFRGSSVFSIAVIENLLKEKYNKENFKMLIDNAKADKLINEKEEYYLNGLRLDRNDLVHNASCEISENESLMIIHLAMRIVNEIL